MIVHIILLEFEFPFSIRMRFPFNYNMTQYLKIKTLSWDKQQYELFDNESNSYLMNTYNVSGAGYIYRMPNESETLYVK